MTCYLGEYELTCSTTSGFIYRVSSPVSRRAPNTTRPYLLLALVLCSRPWKGSRPDRGTVVVVWEDYRTVCLYPSILLAKSYHTPQKRHEAAGTPSPLLTLRGRAGQRPTRNASIIPNVLPDQDASRPITQVETIAHQTPVTRHHHPLYPLHPYQTHPFHPADHSCCQNVGDAVFSNSSQLTSPNSKGRLVTDPQ